MMSESKEEDRRTHKRDLDTAQRSQSAVGILHPEFWFQISAMSFSGATNTPKEKRRRVTRACDACRRKKIRCDGAQDLEQCTPCSEVSLECTWQDEAKKRGRPQKELSDLKERVRELEEVIRIMKSQNNSSHLNTSTASSPRTEGSTQERRSTLSPDSDDLSGSSDEEEPMESLMTRTRRLDLDALSFTGGVARSNGVSFNNRVFKLRDENATSSGHSLPQQQEPEEKADFWQSHVRAQLMYWQMNVHFQFPDPDLIPALINAYMVNFNDLWPLLHRPSFERQVYDGVHLSDPSFGSVLLLVCALGARFINDARVIPSGHNTRRAAGWQWFVQVDISRRDLFRSPRLLDVQTYILAAFYGGTIFRSQLSWVLLGIAIRMIHQIGAHSKKVYSAVPNADDELWKRCFWVAYVVDIVMASETGRPSLMCETDFDLDLPIECDDEYWEVQDPALAFQQPAGTHSKLAYFIRIIKLRQIHLKAMRYLFSPGSALKTDELDDVVVDLDSQLNGWLESTPSHMKWDAHASSIYSQGGFQNQAAHLKMEHNYLLIVIHRPFITFGRPSAASLAAHAICTNAARGNARIFESSTTWTMGTQMLMAAVSSAMILLIGVWGANKLDPRVDLDAVMKDIHHCQDALKSLAPMFQVAETISGDLDRLVASAPPQRSFRLAQKRSPEPPTEDTSSNYQAEAAFDFRNSHALGGHHPHAYQDEGGATMLQYPDQLGGSSQPMPPMPPNIYESGTTSEQGQLWDQTFFTFFDQMGPQYAPLHQNPHMADTMNYGSGSWSEPHEKWSMYGSSYPPGH